MRFLRALKFRISRKSLEKLYTSYIRPRLEYSDTVWDKCSAESSKQLEAIHTEAARIVPGATKLCSMDKLFMDLMYKLYNNYLIALACICTLCDVHFLDINKSCNKNRYLCFWD